jgi:hypothetical protein
MLFEFSTTPQLMIIEGSAARSAPGSRRGNAISSRTIIALLDCPPLAFGTRYLLVGRDGAGLPVTLGIGRAISASDTLNRAEVRHQAACLGAKEVHILAGH